MRIGIVGCGMMGAAVGALLQHKGAEVLMLLEGRSGASIARAVKAGLGEAPLAEVAACDFVLSIVPPDAAGPVVDRLLPHLGEHSLFVECNALDPRDARALCQRVLDAGHKCADGGIVGPAPSLDGDGGPIFYLSGDDAADGRRLAEYGLKIELLDAPVGSASALKMTFAGVSKGATALIGQMLAYADSEHVLEPALAQLRRSHPALVAWAERQFPLLDRKAGRWVQEMEILSALTSGIPGGKEHFSGMAEFYAAIAADCDGPLLTRLREISRKA